MLVRLGGDVGAVVIAEAVVVVKLVLEEGKGGIGEAGGKWISTKWS